MKEISFDDFADLLCSGDDCIKSKEWACTEGVDGYANQYEIEIYNLRISNLSADEYTILHFLVDIDDYDAIIGYRADDSYFSFARAFVNNEISLGQLSHAMRLGKLGEQFVLLCFSRSRNHLSFGSPRRSYRRMRC